MTGRARVFPLESDVKTIHKKATSNGTTQLSTFDHENMFECICSAKRPCEFKDKLRLKKSCLEIIAAGPLWNGVYKSNRK